MTELASPREINDDWFDRSQPFDGAMHHLGFFGSLSFGTPAEREGHIFAMSVLLSPLAWLQFASHQFLAVAPSGSVIRTWKPSLVAENFSSAKDKAVAQFAANQSLSNVGLKQRWFRLMVCPGTDMPPRFTLGACRTNELKLYV